MTTRQTPEMQALYRAVLSLETEAECSAFFQDLCTAKELQAMAQRLEVARQLTNGKNYNAVCGDTGASSATISRVSRCLMQGSGGYRMALERCREERENG